MIAPAKRKVRSRKQFYENEEAMWSAYLSDRSITNRNSLIEFHLPLVRSIAKRLGGILSQKTPVADMVQDGVVGLIFAIERFDPSRGLRFSTWASLRIRGSMIDAIRERDDIPRSARLRSKQLSEAIHRWEVRHGKPPTDAQLARNLKISRSLLECWKALAKLCEIETFRLTTPLFCPDDSDRERVVGDVITDARQESPDRHLERIEIRARLLKGLNKAERIAVVMYYLMGETMKKTGAHLGLSQSRISQMLTECRKSMKARNSCGECDDSSGRAKRLNNYTVRPKAA